MNKTVVDKGKRNFGFHNLKFSIDSVIAVDCARLHIHVYIVVSIAPL